jgi:GAF domain-containing protein
MQDKPDRDPRVALAAAQRQLQEQAEEIARLRELLDKHQHARELRDALRLAASTGTIASPVSHSALLEMIVTTAAHVIHARAGGLLTVDDQRQELVFEVAIGPKGSEAKHLRVPLGHGVAGLVALSGQPMAISNTQQDSRDAADIAQAVGYVPRTILCVPLLYGDRVVGVLELLDKDGAESFTPGDIESLSLFASQAAVAVAQSRAHHHLAPLVAEVVKSLADVPADRSADLQRYASLLAVDLEDDPGYGRALELARLVQQIVGQGEAEAQVCRRILQSFADYLQARNRALGGIGGLLS